MLDNFIKNERISMLEKTSYKGNTSQKRKRAHYGENHTKEDY